MKTLSALILAAASLVSASPIAKRGSIPGIDGQPKMMLLFGSID
jgi:hypothetical protein